MKKKRYLRLDDWLNWMCSVCMWWAYCENTANEKEHAVNLEDFYPRAIKIKKADIF